MNMSKAPLAAVIGHPVNHSRSPRMHNYWLAQFGLVGYYIPLDIDPKKFERSIRNLPELGFVGANITIPYKEKVLKIANRLHRAPTFKSVIIDERSMKKSLF